MTVYTSALTGEEIDRRLAYVSYLEQLNTQPIGIKWDSSSQNPILTRIDINGNTITPSTSFFDNHKIWGGIRRCVRNRTTGAITYGSDNAGTGLTLDGTAGDVFVEIPTAKYKFKKVGTDYYFWLIPYTTEDTKFTIHPSAVQRSGTARSKIYVGAFEAGLRDDAGTLKLKSVSGAQPWTGGEMYSRTFTSGSTAFTPDETLTGATSGATAKVVDYHVTSGSWAGGDAAGTVYLKQPSGTFVSEDVNGSTSGNNCATVGGALTGISLNLGQAEGYANALGTGFGIMNYWTHAYIQLLIAIETGSFNSQSTLGQGCVNMASSTGFAGKNTGADSINTRLGTNGTGTGNGTAGYTPVCWRGLENLWGNVWEYLIGLNLNLSDGAYRIIKRDGTSTPASTLSEGTYETGSGTVPTSADGYITGIQSDELGAIAFIPSANAGSSTTYLCDYFYKPTASPSVVRCGGSWYSGAPSGINLLSADNTILTFRHIGCRLEYLP